MNTLDGLLGLALGIGLAAACGFRVFVPLLVAGIASKAGYLELAGGFSWMGSNLAIAIFAVATALEIGAYWIPWVDNALDVVATPSAVIAGTLVAASTLGDTAPVLQWTLAAIAGGGAAGLVQTATTVVRQVSSATTGGLANPLLSTAEAAGSATLSILVVLVPLVGIVLLGAAAWLLLRLVRRRGSAELATA